MNNKIKITPIEQNVYIESDEQIHTTFQNVLNVLEASGLSTPAIVFILEGIKTNIYHPES